MPNTRSVPAQYHQEFNEQGQHRIVHDDGRKTKWAHYTRIAYMDGVVSHSAYYATIEMLCTPDEFCRLIATA